MQRKAELLLWFLSTSRDRKLLSSKDNSSRSRIKTYYTSIFSNPAPSADCACLLPQLVGVSMLQVCLQHVSFNKHLIKSPLKTLSQTPVTMTLRQCFD